jgi:transcription elongation GreA/GreB family factor
LIISKLCEFISPKFYFFSFLFKTKKLKINKNKLLNQVKLMLDERMKISFDAMQAAQESANEEGKSSAGDKYETGRAMAQIERNRYAQQFEAARQERAFLDKIDEKLILNQVGLGALVDTSAGTFFVAVSVGLVNFEANQVMVISQQSPIGILLFGRKIGEKFIFRGKENIILEII